MTAMELIRHRRSVRTFDGNPLKEEDIKRVLAITEDADNPYGIPITWKLLDVKRDNLKSPVIVGADTFIAGTMDRSAFERAMELGEGEVMPCVSPLGYPAKKMSLREEKMEQ